MFPYVKTNNDVMSETKLNYENTKKTTPKQSHIQQTQQPPNKMQKQIAFCFSQHHWEKTPTTLFNFVHLTTQEDKKI